MEHGGPIFSLGGEVLKKYTVNIGEGGSTVVVMSVVLVHVAGSRL